MRLQIFQVDAFTDTVFGGNPAAVCPLDSWLDDATLQAIAYENNLSETAFLVPANGAYALRWFTPLAEVDLCGHATLASAHVVFHHLRPDADSVAFDTRSGRLDVARDEDGLTMDFPALAADPVETPADLSAGLGAAPVAVFADMDYLALFETEAQIRAIAPDMAALARLDERRGVIVTAPGESADFVSRFFCPQTRGSRRPGHRVAHCMLAPSGASAWARPPCTPTRFRHAAGWCTARSPASVCDLPDAPFSTSKGQSRFEPERPHRAVPRMKPARPSRHPLFSSGRAQAARMGRWTSSRGALLGRSHRGREPWRASRSCWSDRARFSGCRTSGGSESFQAPTPAPSRWPCGRSARPARGGLPELGQIRGALGARRRPRAGPWTQRGSMRLTAACRLAQVDPDRDTVFVWNGTTSGVRVPDAEWIAADRAGLTLCDATSAVLAYPMDWTRLDATSYSWQKVLGGEAGFGMLISARARWRGWRAKTPPWAGAQSLPPHHRGRQAQRGHLPGETINTVSMMAVEDTLDALRWIESISGQTHDRAGTTTRTIAASSSRGATGVDVASPSARRRAPHTR
ncbi:Uncharacterized isomerase PA2770 [Geodia barretti]|uniref:Uncharacterized isomerase PA2770 n=1 Tax=Geodia barretti TaxID=519541 RepID=A0AA35SLC7_GEOBA|nr:Uncharacterized isomerase PA2770 [Geodia barretti]